MLSPSKAAEELKYRFSLLKDDAGSYLGVTNEVARAGAIEAANLLKLQSDEKDYWDAVISELSKK